MKKIDCTMLRTRLRYIHFLPLPTNPMIYEMNTHSHALSLSLTHTHGWKGRAANFMLLLSARVGIISDVWKMGRGRKTLYISTKDLMSGVWCPQKRNVVTSIVQGKFSNRLIQQALALSYTNMLLCDTFSKCLPGFVLHRFPLL